MSERTGAQDLDAVRQYFGQPGFARFLALLRNKYEASKAGPKGYIRLSHASEEERSTLDGFYGIYSPIRPSGTENGSELKYSIGSFVKILLASRFHMTLAELFETLDGGSVLTRGQLLMEEDRAWREIFRAPLEWLVKELGHSGHAREIRLVEWVRGLEEGASPGFRTLRMLFAARREAAADCLSSCVRALKTVMDRESGNDQEVAESSLRLPVLSARLTGDAHALDWKHPLGRLFWWGLVAVFRDREEGGLSFADGVMDEGATEVEVESEADPDQAENTRNISRALIIREGYRKAGIADDDLSSQVMFFAPGWDGSWEERVLTLRQVERLKRDDMGEFRPSAVYAVENPSVFAVLADEAAKRKQRWSSNYGAARHNELPILICGNGQLSVATVKLLERLLDPRNAHPPALFYSGDLDVAGLEIARSLQQRFPDSFRAWKMDAALFGRYADRGMTMTTAECGRMAKLSTPWDVSLPGLSTAASIKLHQELWMDELASDWLLNFAPPNR